MVTLDISRASAVLMQAQLPLYGCLCIINIMRNERREVRDCRLGLWIRNAQQHGPATGAEEDRAVKLFWKPNKLYRL